MAKFSSEQIQERILAHLRKDGVILPDDINLQTPIKDLQLDSLAVITLLFMIEEEFEIEVPQGSEATFEVLGDVVDMIVKSVGAKSAA